MALAATGRFPLTRRRAARASRSVDRLGEQAIFFGQALGSVPRAAVRYKKETIRLVAEISMGSGALGGFGCVSRSDYVRNVLVEGLRHDQRLGVNPFQYGIIGATDTRGEDASDRIVGRDDFLATMYHHLGIDADHVALADFAGRPVPILRDGDPIHELTATS